MRIEELKAVEPFGDLDESALTQLTQEFVEFFLPEDYPVFQEGSELEAFYVVKQGCVVVYRDVVGKPVQLLTRVGPGQYFGEFALFTHSESTISARTTEKSRLLKIDRAPLLAVLDNYPAIMLKLEMAAARRHSINAAAALELGQRNEVRIRVNREVVLILADGSYHVATLDNLSPGGLSLKDAPSSWQQGDEVRFEIALKNTNDLECTGRVAWSRGELVGVAFSEASPDHEQRIQSSLRHLLAPRKVAS